MEVNGFLGMEGFFKVNLWALTTVPSCTLTFQGNRRSIRVMGKASCPSVFLT